MNARSIILPALIGAVGCAFAGGCAGSGQSHREPALHGIDASASAADRLAQLAAPQTAEGSAVPIDARIPPGIEPELLSPRPAEHPRAWLPLDEALRIVAAETPVDLAPAPADQLPTNEEQDEALRRYMRGRDALLDDRVLVAITDLQQAAAIDPSSPNILRALARCHLMLGNLSAASGVYGRLLSAAPDDEEALFELGVAAANRREFARAVALLGRARLTGRNFSHDVAARYLADYTLAVALGELEFDRAFIAAAGAAIDLPSGFSRATMHGQRLRSLVVQRGEICRGIGDAHCRLGEFDEALAVYAVAAELPAAEPDAIHPRVVFAELRRGRPMAAQARTLRALQVGEPAVSERDVRLCAYLADELPGAVDPLSQAVVELHHARPEDAALVRAAAALLPADRAVALLREVLDRRPEDVEAFAQLQQWLMERNPAGAMQLAVAQSQQQPSFADAYAHQVIRSSADLPALLGQVRAVEPGPSRTNMEARVLLALSAEARAYHVCRNAMALWPDDVHLHRLAIEIAAELSEPGLVTRAIDASAAFDDAETWLVRARAWRGTGRFADALAAAETAFARNASSAAALLEQARAFAAQADRADSADRRDALGQDAVDRVEQALTIDPSHEHAFEALLSLHSSEGVAADAARLEQALRRLRSTLPDSRLFRRLTAQTSLAQRRFDAALETLLDLIESDRSDDESLRLAVEAWKLQDRRDVALRWLEQQMQSRPHDPLLLRQWTQLQADAREYEAVFARLKPIVDAHPDYGLARRLLEDVYRLAGREAEFRAMTEARCLERPEGVRRELELAALYVSSGRTAEALERIRWISDHLEEAQSDHAVSALAILRRAGAAGPEVDALTVELAERAVSLFDDAPVALYGAALEAIVRSGDDDSRFDALLASAQSRVPGMMSPEADGVGRWLRLAQGLVDADLPRAAARVVEKRLFATPQLKAEYFSILSHGALAAWAAEGDSAAAEALVHRIAGVGRLADFLAAEDQEATLGEVLVEASIIFNTVGSEAESEALLEAALQAEPLHAMALNNLGYMRLEDGRADERTIQMIEQAFRLRPGDDNILDTLGWLRYKQGILHDHANRGADGLGALTLLRLARNTAQDPAAEVLDHLGDALWRAGRSAEALQAWVAARDALDSVPRLEAAIQRSREYQQRFWGLLVADPSERYDRQIGDRLESLRGKTLAAQQGGRPAVSPTLAELAAPDETAQQPVAPPSP